MISCSMNNENTPLEKNAELVPFEPPIAYEEAYQVADSIVGKMSIDERIDMIGGHNSFFIKEVESANLPRLYLSDATQGVHIRKNLDDQLEKSVAMPCPILLTSTWNRTLAKTFAQCIGEECRAGDIAVLLGPGMNIYRIAENGRNFEYFGEDPYLAARMIENYVVGIQNTGTIATLKHYIANNSDYHRRRTNSVVSSRALHEIYLPAFKAGVDAGAMAVMTSYNLINGEYASQNKHMITDVLRKELGFKWLVMSDWWSVWEPEKAIKSGLDLDMPGDGDMSWSLFSRYGDSFVRSNAKRLLSEGKVAEDDISRMARNIITTELAMGLSSRPVKNKSFLDNFSLHEFVALETAREGIVLLKNENNILPITDKSKNILATGTMMLQRMSGGGSADVEGYNWAIMVHELKAVFGDQFNYIERPTDEQIQDADIILTATGTLDNEGWNRPFELPEEENERIKNLTENNDNVVVIVNSGGGIGMSEWDDDIAGLIYAWYPGQKGNVALAEIVSGAICPSGKLPITIEKKFEDSPGYPYLPEGEELYEGWDGDNDMMRDIQDLNYKEDIFVGYRWYESKKIEPLYAFGYGLSYTQFEYEDLKLSASKIKPGETLKVQFTIENIGQVEGAEIAQLYIKDLKSSVIRPVKELKDFIKVYLNPGELKTIELEVKPEDLAFYGEEQEGWVTEAGKFKVMIGAASNDIRLSKIFTLE